jgi:hypothetical protein
MATYPEIDEILKAASEVNRLKAGYDAAVLRFQALVDGRRIGKTMPAPVRKHKGKVADPKSLNQRVLAEITRSPAPAAIDSLAILLNATPKQVRHAIVYHQKKGRVVRVGPGEYTLTGRMNGNGVHAA